jgi:DNA adenine methylase|tara:strand:+ start:1970 stop:2812 length:843 start_codon:yes stop_codon:yes gene_type:complete
MKTSIAPMFKWTGSKQRMLEQYAPHFFPEGEFTRFVDLFAGGLTNSLWVYEKFPQKEFVVNDWNGELTLLYATLADSSDEVINQWFKCVEKWLSLSEVDDRKKYYYELREVYCLENEGKSDVYLSALLLFMLQVNFNGMWKAYKKCNERYSTPPGTCLQKQSFFDVNKIKNVASFLEKATICNGDFASVNIKDGDWLYADPPYRDSIVLYQGGFSEDDQVRLARFLMESGCKFAYSNKHIGDTFYEDNFDGANIIEMNAKYTAGRGTSTLDVKEVLVTNY